MSSRRICIHGHFYQPPRENPWLESVEVEDSAYPYHDWNERVTAESYGPNALARILDRQGRIERIINNYARISFNFGPTLLAWMERSAPAVYRAVLEADRESLRRFGGCGSAMAQAYNHLILPLANARDRATQVRWGIADFEHRFGRRPEGMWLPEAAVDLPALEALAEAGLAFTVLAPHQARRVRRPGGGWTAVGLPGNAGIDPRRPYRCPLPSGRSIDLFFYDGAISRGVAFERLLDDGGRFAERLAAGFRPDDGDEAQLVHVATDGETYGHHHRHGDMALAFALHHLEATHRVELTNYARFLADHPPTWEVEIAEETSWSCAHGIERWRSDCGCSTGGAHGENQAWRAPLRAALDALRDRLAPAYEAAAGELFADPWAARDAAIAIVLDRSPESVDRFFAAHARGGLAPDERVRALKLLELQRAAMLMYTSCGWFFHDLAGLETVQILRYAGRALQLGEELFGDGPSGQGLESDVLARLETARSNRPDDPDWGDGRRIYEHAVRPARVDLAKVGAHDAISALFSEGPEEDRIGCFTVRRRERTVQRAGRARLALGRVEVASEVTLEAAAFAFAVLHLGDQNLTGGVAAGVGPAAYAELSVEIGAVFTRGDLAGVIRLLDRTFAGSTFSFESLFRDRQRKILGEVLATTRVQIEDEYRRIYDDHAPLMRFLSDLGIPLPQGLKAAAEFVLDRDLARVVGNGDFDLDEVRRTLAEAARWHLRLDTEGLAVALARSLDRLAEELLERPEDAALLARLGRGLDLAGSFPFPVDLWEAQNAFYRLVETAFPARAAAAGAGDPAAAEWLATVRALGEALRVRVG